MPASVGLLEGANNRELRKVASAGESAPILTGKALSGGSEGHVPGGTGDGLLYNERLLCCGVRYRLSTSPARLSVQKEHLILTPWIGFCSDDAIFVCRGLDFGIKLVYDSLRLRLMDTGADFQAGVSPGTQSIFVPSWSYACAGGRTRKWRRGC